MITKFAARNGGRPRDLLKVSRPMILIAHNLFQTQYCCSNFRIVRAVPETLNSSEFLYKKSVFGTSMFSIFRKFAERHYVL